jgi:hypothetical protein
MALAAHGVGAVDRLQAAVAGDGDGGVVGWGGVEQQVPPPPKVVLGEGARPARPAGFALLSRVGLGQALLRWPLGLGPLVRVRVAVA